MKPVVNYITSKSSLHIFNEDCLFIGDQFFIVADGMGGERDGNIASSIAVNTIAEMLDDEIVEDATDCDIKNICHSAIKKADSGILEFIKKNPGSSGMGTTVLLLVLHDNKTYVSWCGDSHCFRFTDGKIYSVTRDHSLVQELIDAGEITEEESFFHPDNYIITRFVGGGKYACLPDFKIQEVKDGDILIMCSDGLSGYCNHREIEQVISSVDELQCLPLKLKELAVEHGSDDDITIIAIVFKFHKFKRGKFRPLSWLKNLF